MVDPSHVFHIADYVVFGLTIVISIGIGIYYALSGGRQRTTSEYLVGERTMKFLPVAISLMVSFESSIMMLGLPAEMYVYGVQWWMSTVGFLVSNMLAILIMVPLLHPLKVTSAYEYLQYRFNSTPVRLLGSTLGILTYAWYMGIVLFGPAIALEAVTGFPQWGSIFIVSFVAIIYTAIGGLKAVIWTDVFQAFIMYAGMLAILIKGTVDVGSPAQVWHIARAGGRLDFFNFDLDPRTRHTFWNLFFGAIIRGFGLAFNQSTVQRVSSTNTLREARWVMLIMVPCFFISLSMACYEGIVAYAYYQTKGCDPLASDKITDPNQIIPFTVMDIFQAMPGMPGLFLASLFSASLSTLSSGLSSLSALLWTDMLKPRIGEVSEFKATVIAKISVVFFGLTGCGIAILVSLIGGPLTQISTSLLAAFSGPLTGLFLLGCFCPWANSKGALIGGILSLIFSSWLSMGKVFAKNVKREPWLPPASMAQCLANHSSLFNTSAPPGGVSLGFTPSLETEGDAYNYYSTLAGLAMTTEASVEYEPQGIEVVYTMSYQWLQPVSIISTMILATIISLITGGNKKGSVNPRYLISFCDHLCCFLPACFRKLFRCADDYSTVKEEDAKPLRDIYVPKEIIINADTEDNANAKEDETSPMLQICNDDENVTGSDVKDVKPRQDDQNGGSYVRYSAADDVIHERNATNNKSDDFTQDDNKANAEKSDA